MTLKWFPLGAYWRKLHETDKLIPNSFRVCNLYVTEGCVRVGWGENVQQNAIGLKTKKKNTGIQGTKTERTDSPPPQKKLRTRTSIRTHIEQLKEPKSE